MAEIVEEKEKAQGIHRELVLKVQGKDLAHGDWKKLMRIALNYGSKTWEIVEVLPVGDRLITVHKGLLPSIFLGTDDNTKGV